jgi:nitroimidazol reductase NimA-like FMN-containing flavoprotein (pyridoxamine 5'-phosphate oxidase superfamily)
MSVTAGGDEDPRAIARRILDTNRYMVLATAGGEGRPWASPVYYAPEGYGELFWVSRPGATHSRNIAERPSIAIVVFDSQAAIGTGQGVYMSATAEQVTGEELERGIEVFSRVSQRHGARPWTTEDVTPPAELRLYRASVTEHSILDPTVYPGHGRRDVRIPVTP